MSRANGGDTLDDLMVVEDTSALSAARRTIEARLEEFGLDDDLTTSVQLVANELITNALLHAGGPARVQLGTAPGGVRLNVFDPSHVMPVVPAASTTAMTGRGLLLVRSLSAQFGFEPVADGKVVWAELRTERLPGDADTGSLIDAWADTWDDEEPGAGSFRHRIELGDVPRDLLLASKAHVDNVVREFLLAAGGAVTGVTADVPAHMAELIENVVNRFAEARLSIKRQALEAARKGQTHVRLRLDLGPDAADAGEDYLRALDEVDAYCRAARLLTLEMPPRQRVFRHWYVGQIITQLRRAEQNLPPVSIQPFEDRLLDEIDDVANARAAAERVARLYTVASALGAAMTPEAVAEAVLAQGVAALGASGGGLLLATETDRLTVPATVGYDESIVEKLRAESSGAELPAAVALRTGEPVWLGSREERDRRFPELINMERSTISVCAVPLQIGPRRLGAIRFSFSEPRLFDEHERGFVMALAAQAAQALDRAKVYNDRIDASRRLQRSLLPPGLPSIPGVDLAAIYHPLGDGAEVGGDFYDVWPVSDGRWLFAIGDVSGTGPEAAGVTALVRHSLRAITMLDNDIEATLVLLNDILQASVNDDDERFCTVLLGAITPGPPGRSGVQVRMTTGGHPGPVVRRSDGSAEIMATSGSLLGILPAIVPQRFDIHLAPGDSLILYTDGVTEARVPGGTMFGSERLIDSVSRAPFNGADTAAAIEYDVVAHSAGALHDDLAVLVVSAIET